MIDSFPSYSTRIFICDESIYEMWPTNPSSPINRWLWCFSVSNVNDAGKRNVALDIQEDFERSITVVMS